MQFLSPWMLWGLAALAVPVAIHLWRRRKVVTLPFGTLKYLRAASASTRRSARLENLLLLLLRCAIVGLLVLAAARPAAHRNALRGFGGGVTRTVVFILDRSMSMGYRAGERTRLDVAKDEALLVLDHLQAGDEAAAFAVDDHTGPLVAQATQDRAVLRRAIAGVRPGEAGTDFSTALVAAGKLLAAARTPEKEVYLFTDNQASGWQFDPAVAFGDAWKKSGASLFVVQPDDTAASNAAVSKVTVTTPLATVGERITGAATVANHAASPLHDVLTVSLAGGDPVNVAVEAPPHGSQEIAFDLRLPAFVPGRVAAGEARLQGDNLPADDAFFFSVPVHQPPRAVVFQGASVGPERVRGGYYLRRALAVGARPGDEVPAQPAGAIEETSLASYSVVFLADVPRLSDRAVVKLGDYARNGGTVVFFPGEQTDVAALAKADFLPATPLRTRDLPDGRLSSQIMEPGHPLFADTWSQETPFPPLPQHRLIEWRLKPGARTLVLAGGSEAFLIEGALGAGRVYVVNASPDRAWGDFPLSPAFLPLAQQIALQSTERGRRPGAYTVGQAVPAGPLLPRDQGLTLGLPDGTSLPLLLGERGVVLERAPLAGHYRVGPAGQPPLLEFDGNTPARESALDPITEAALGRITPHETIAGPDNLGVWLARPRGMIPWWPALLGLAALLFAAEHVLSNLVARRRAQGAAASIRTGRLNRRRPGSPFRAGGARDAEPAVASTP